MKLIFTVIFLLLISCFTGFLLWLAHDITFFNIDENFTETNSQKPSILHLHIVSGFGGGENHSLTLYKMLQSAGYTSLIVVQDNSPMRAELDRLKLPYATTRVSIVKFIPLLFRFVLGYQLENIFEHHHFDIIQCNTEREVDAAKQVAEFHQAKIIFFRHLRSPLNKTETLNNLDGIVAVSEAIKQNIEQIITQKNYTTKNIAFIPPFFNQEPFLNFTPLILNKRDFFKAHFDVDITDAPILCMVANTSPRLDYKNYPLLLRAVAQLVHEKKIPVQVIAVGRGAGKAKLEAMSKELKVDHCVHFVGFSKDIPEVLYHSDIFVLTSNWEAFGIVYLEAGLMKKPAVGAYQTGAQDTIIDGETGFLFKNNNCDDLVAKLEFLIKNPKLQKEMGQRSYKNISAHFLNETKFEQLEKLFEEVLKK